MPFTLAHPAAAGAFRPLVRRGWLPLAALAVGTMSPDFEYLIHLRPLALWGHSAAGLVTFCLPAGLLVLAAWELVVRAPVRDFLGVGDDVGTDDAERPRRGTAVWWALAAVAVLAGAATHLLWDGLTHGGYWGGRMIPALHRIALSAWGREVPWFNVFQHASTLAGGTLVLAWLARILRDANTAAVVARSPWRRAALAFVVATAALTGAWNAARQAAHDDLPHDYWSAQRWLSRVAVGVMAGGVVALAGYAVAWQALAGRRRAADGDDAAAAAEPTPAS